MNRNSLKKNCRGPFSGYSGQVMLLTVLFLSAAFLTVTVIAGYVMLTQISQTSEIANSAQAIFCG